MSGLREFTKFACGWEAFHAFIHAFFWASGVSLTVFGITLTPALKPCIRCRMRTNFTRLGHVRLGRICSLVRSGPRHAILGATARLSTNWHLLCQCKT